MRGLGCEGSQFDGLLVEKWQHGIYRDFDVECTANSDIQRERS